MYDGHLTAFKTQGINLRRPFVVCLLFQPVLSVCVGVSLSASRGHSTRLALLREQRRRMQKHSVYPKSGRAPKVTKKKRKHGLCHGAPCGKPGVFMKPNKEEKQTYCQSSGCIFSSGLFPLPFPFPGSEATG